MILCSYGCGQKAIYTFKNGKPCCSKNHKQCPIIRKTKRNYKMGKSHQIVYCNYCKKEFYYSNLSSHELSCYLNPENIKYCLECKRILNNKVNTFCCRSCSVTYNNKKRKHTTETKIKISKKLKGRKILNNRYYDRISVCPVCKEEKIIRSVIENNKPRIKTCSKECYKKYLSLKIKEVGSGGYRENSGYGKSGYYKNIYCASTYELIFLAYHLEIGNNIKRSKHKFKYKYNEKYSYYHPDFEIDGILYEIKGYETEKTQLKINSARNNGYKIYLLFYEDISAMEVYLKNKFVFKSILELYDSVD